MSASTKLSEARERIKACHRELIELETRAGIVEAAEKLRTEPPSYFSIYDAAEPYSDEQRELERSEEAFHQQRINRRIRDLHFEIRDVELRRQLIVKDREVGALALDYWRQELSDAAANLEKARASHGRWWLWASVWGVALLALGFQQFGLIGALGGLLVGYLNGRQSEHGALRERSREIAEAERELKDAEEIWNKVRNEPQIFSQREAKTGVPDPESILLLRL